MLPLKKIIGKIFKKKSTKLYTKLYKVSGQHYLTDEELTNLLSRGNYTHIKKEGENTYQPISPEDNISFENARTKINMPFEDLDAALDYARKRISDGLDGSNAAIKEYGEPSFSEMNSKLICELRKENGKIVETNHW